MMRWSLVVTGLGWGMAWLAMIAVLPACGPSARAPVAAPSSRPGGGGDLERLVAPALFAHIPADTPFALGTFEAIPADFYAGLARALRPAYAWTRAELRSFAPRIPQLRVADAMFQELEAHWTEQGRAALGLSASPRFAVYSLDQSVVARLEVKDSAAVLAAVERVARRVGAALPPLERRGAVAFWRLSLGGGREVVFSFGRAQVALAIGATASISGRLPEILGEVLPAHNMADGALFKQLVAQHKLGPLMIGFARTSWLALRLLDPPPETRSLCEAAFELVEARAPQLVFGLSELSEHRTIGGAILEADPAVRGALEAMRTEVPGVGAALAEEGALVFGGAVDLSAVGRAVQTLAGLATSLGSVCEARRLMSLAREAQDLLTTLSPSPLAGITGLAVALESQREIDAVERDTLPDDSGIFLMVTTADAASATALLSFVPRRDGASLGRDGKLHAVDFGVSAPLLAGATETVIAGGAGDFGRRRAERALSSPRAAPAPLFAFRHRPSQQPRALPALGTGGPIGVGVPLARAFSRFLMHDSWSLTAAPDEHGLAVRFSGGRP